MSAISGGDEDLNRILRADHETESSEGEEASAEVAVVLPMLDRRGHPDPGATLAAWRRADPEGAGRSVLLVSSSEAQPPIYGHAGQVAEKSPSALSGRHPCSDRWCRYEQDLIAEAEERGVPWRILRPAPVLRSKGRDPWSQLFSARLAIVAMGFSPPVQFLHCEDLGAAIHFAAAHFDRLPEIIHVAPEDAMPLKKALGLAGLRRFHMPFALIWLWRKVLGLFSSTSPRAESLDRLRYSFTISGRSLAELGFSPRRGTAAAISRAAPAELRHDPFGLDLERIASLRRSFFRFFHDVWWRVDVNGLEKVPAEGPAILMGVHRGLVPFDAIMALHEIVGAHGRVPRFLIHPALLRFPFIGDLMRALGGVVACRENAEWVLSRGEILGLFPEGVRGAFSTYKSAFEVRRFGRAEFVRLAVRHQARCSLFVTLGSAEVFPVLGTLDWKWWKKWSGWPCFPLTPTPIPLPVKWHTLFLSPFEIEAEGRDRGTAKKYGKLVHGRLQRVLLAMRSRRKSWFWGRVIDESLIRLAEDVESAEDS